MQQYCKSKILVIHVAFSSYKSLSYRGAYSDKALNQTHSISNLKFQQAFLGCQSDAIMGSCSNIYTIQYYIY